MSLPLLLVLASLITEPPPPPPPMVSATPETPTSDGPRWQVTALATANVPLALTGSDFLLGLRGEVDVWRISALLTFDRTGTTPLTIAETRHWTGLLGSSLVLNKYARVRALGGVSALSTDTTSQFGPSLGTTARIGWSFLAAEAGVVFTPFGFRQLDARVEAVLKGGVFELHAGYRARFVDASATGTLATLLGSAPVAGPSIALGVSF